MEVLKQTFNQFRILFQSMSSSQKITLAMVPLMLFVAMFFLIQTGATSSYVPLSLGKVYSPEELVRVTETLSRSGLLNFRTEGQQILVPSKEVERYNAALLVGGSLSAGWASEWERKFDEKAGNFTSSKNLQTIKEIQLAKEFRRTLRAVPSIEDASVIWTEAKRRGFSRGTSRTATVFVKPSSGQQLSMSLVQGIRHAIAGAIDGLKAEDVVVFDQVQMRHYSAERDDDPYNSVVLNRIKDFTEMFQGKIAEQLSFIPGVIVTVDVELDKTRSKSTQSQDVNAKVVPINTRERITKQDSSDQPMGAEPGMKSNTGADLASMRSNTKIQKSQQTETESSNVPTTMKLQNEVINGGMPESVQVAVFIPKDYYRTLAADAVRKEGNVPEGETEDEKNTFEKEVNGRVEAVETAFNTKVEGMVRNAIPANSTQNAVRVSSFIRGELAIPEVEVPFTQTIGNLLSQWGGAVGLALFALWALRMIGRTAPSQVIPESSEGNDFTLQLPGISEDSEAEEDVVPEESKRDELQVVVKDNPEMAAAVLSKWMRSGML